VGETEEEREDEASQVDDMGDLLGGGEDDMSLESLVFASTRVATKVAKPLRETPGVVTVISRDEILSSGARDLIDVLQLVPGFTFGVDVEGVVGLGFRGAWGHEGKILMLIDGHDFNELLYSTLQFGHHYPIDQIQWIEIMRGPGSALYGGFAELAVINIVTRGGGDISGVEIAGNVGRRDARLGQRGGSFAYGQTLSQLGVTFSVQGYWGQGDRSTADYRGFVPDAEGKPPQQYSLEGNSDQQPLFVNASASYRNAKVSFLFDDYHVESRDEFWEVLEKNVDMGFRRFSLDAEYELRQGPLTVTPHAAYKHDTPWQILDKKSPLYYDKSVERVTGGLTAIYQATPDLNLLVGIEAYRDKAKLNAPPLPDDMGLQIKFSGEDEVRYENAAVFGQALFDHPIANLAVGGRFERHSKFGDSFVPRIAATRVIGSVGLKLLASRAFRAPGIENIHSIGDAKKAVVPEETTVLEMELSLQPNENMFFSANVFDLTIEKPIVYATVNGEEIYSNHSQTGTRGIEAEFRVKHPRGSATFGYSYYHAAGKNEVEPYSVPGHDAYLLGLPPHKLTFRESLKLYRGLTLNASAVLLGERYGYLSGDAEGNGVLGREPLTLFLDAFVWYRDMGIDGVDLGVGVHNALGQRFRYLQPYNSGHAPLPGLEREVVLRVSYSHSL
jgi:outer membrane cobalamin receptor